MKHLAIVDVNQVQRDDLISRLQNAVPGTDGLYRIVLNATETQRLTVLKHFNTPPTVPPVVESGENHVVPPAPFITDDLGDVYRLDDSGNVTRNDEIIFDTWKGRKLVWHNHDLYLQDFDATWFRTDRDMGDLTCVPNPLVHHDDHNSGSC